MEAYPAPYAEHNLPLVFLSGLGERDDEESSEYSAPRQENGTKVATGAPECEGDRASRLLQQFIRFDGSDQPWNAAAMPGPSGNLKYRMKAIGRTCTLPTRKAAPLPQAPSADGFQDPIANVPRSTELHSTLSPLSPTSPIFPDGIFTPLWFVKHQVQVPCLFLAFFNISAAGDSSQDDQIKTDINAVRAALQRSGFKTRFAAVLLSDKSIVHAPDLEDRLAAIRRATNLDPKTAFFFMPPISSQAELATFVQTVMTPLQSVCIEHYRDLTKHARRKKSRGGPPPSASAPAGSHTLATPGWNARYEIKMGVFAEFRQEMDMAERHYSAAMEELFHPEGKFETTPSWSTRWDQTRLICDSLALRIVRCHLWASSTTAAAQFWYNYKARVQDLVDRRGKGSQTYGWDAWEARWAEVMAQLIQRAGFHSSERQPEGSTGLPAPLSYSSPEKIFSSTERLQPIHYLHHDAYWLRLSAQSMRCRRVKAEGLPEEDLIPPGQSPASAVASRVRNYDYYLVLEPHEESKFDHLGQVARLVHVATERFAEIGQKRLAESMQLELAQDFIDAGAWSKAMDVLITLWESSSWRRQTWNALFAKLLLALKSCADHESRLDMFVGACYELLSLPPSLLSGQTGNIAHVSKHLQANASEPVSLSYEDEGKLSPITIAFAFSLKETHVGEPLSCQVVLTSHAHEQAGPLPITRVTLQIGSSKVVKIAHKATEPEQLLDLSTAKEGPDGSLDLEANLHLNSGQRRILGFSVTFREAAVLQLERASFDLAAPGFSIQHAITDPDKLHSGLVYSKTSGGVLEHKALTNLEPTVVTVLPKPPKVDIYLNGVRKQLYTDEVSQLEVAIFNGEDERVEGKISVSVRGEEESLLKIQWKGSSKHDGEDDDLDIDAGKGSNTPVVKPLPRLSPKASHRETLLVKAPSSRLATTLSVEVNYHLSSDKETPLQKSFSRELVFTAPFEVRHDFEPLLYPGEWPSYFDPEIVDQEAKHSGIPQLWRLCSEIHSLSAEKLALRDTRIQVDEIVGDTLVNIEPRENVETQDLEPGVTATHEFEVQTQKHSLDDRRPTMIESTLAITWSIPGDSGPIVTKLPVPRLTLPVSEPRVLCTLAAETAANSDATLEYHIENPSTHFLTFALTMEASEDFAFSGPKYRTLSVAPLSRHRVEYDLVLHDSGDEEKEDEEGRWLWPGLQVVDSFYQKTLRVHSGGAGVKTDGKGKICVLVGQLIGKPFT